MKHYSFLIKPASALCNLRCKYCFYANISSLREVRSYGRMKPEVTEAMIDNVYSQLDDGDQVTFAFQGGEPTMAGLHYFEHFTHYVNQQEKRVTVNYSIQTNGTVLNEKWMELFKTYNFLVGISIDGTRFHHDLNRVDTREKGTFERVLRGRNLLVEYGIEHNVLMVLTEDLARCAEEVFDFIRSEDLRFVQFIPCLNDLDEEEYNEYALRPESFAKFYKEIYDLWEKAFVEEEEYYSINLLDNIIQLISGHGVFMCGLTGQCGFQMVVEADGSVFPCDFYVLDSYKLGNITEDSVPSLIRNRVRTAFQEERPKPYDYCQDCPFVNMCGGGCKRMKNAMYLNQEENYCGYRDFLSEKLPHMERLSQALYS